MWMEKKRNDRKSGLPSICFQHRKEIYERQDYKHDFTLETAVSWGSPKAASRLSAILNHLFLYLSNIDAQTVNIQFALVSFSGFFFWAKRHHTLYRCSTPMPTSLNDMESINGMVSDYWNIYCEVKIIYRQPIVKWSVYTLDGFLHLWRFMSVLMIIN